MHKDIGKECDKETNDKVQRIIELLLDTVCNPNPCRKMPVDMISNAAFRDLYGRLMDIREAAKALSRGELSKDITGKGFVVAHLKQLQANLRHLTWQTKRIAEGDLLQRVDFMGDFAESFNSMVQSLAIARDDLEKLASIDPLTQCANRRHSFEMGYIEMERAQRNNHPVSILALDMDHFKTINDTFGHPAGDRVLQEVAAIFQKASRTTDIIGRIGGEEFLIILPETALSGAITVADRILTDCRGSYVVLEDSRVVTFTLSIGIACTQKDEWSFDQLLQRADTALYAAKQSGRNQISISKQ